MKIQNNSLQEQPLQIGNLKKLLSKFNQTNNETSHSISANTQIDLNNIIIASCLEIVIVSAIDCKAERADEFGGNRLPQIPN